jgi:hypothetical protein
MPDLDDIALDSRVRQARKGAQARKNSGRRRLIDPTTTDRDYDADEVEFMMAMHRYREIAKRPFPTWSEALEVLKALGYRKTEPAVPWNQLKIAR